ncbi:MAG TPA: hypothetical protein PKD13_01365 [Mariniflexile sp.]|nr:hypothetical protein [Mariniflexile sp.]
MIKQFVKYLFLAIIINSFYLSCTEPVDFDQINDFKTTPVVESSLIFFDEPATRFMDNGNEIATIQDFIQVDFFKSEFITDNLAKAEFVFETNNAINRGFQVRVAFLNNSGQTQHTFTVSIPPSTNSAPVTSRFTELFEGPSLVALKNTTKIVFTLNMLPGAAITNNTSGRISLKSKAVLYFNLESSSL